MSQLSRRARRTRRARLLGLLCGVGVLLAPVTFPLTSAAFSATTADGGNSATAGSISPPSGLAVTQSCSAVPAPVFRAGTSAVGTNSVVLATPAGTAANDLLIAQVSNRDSWPLPTPAGWTLLRRDSSGTQVQAGLYWRLATASEPAGVTFTLTGASNSHIVGAMLAYSGVNTTSPVDVSGVTSGTSMTATTPSITTTARDTLLVHTIAKRQESLPAPAGTTARGSVGTTGAGSLGAVAADETFTGPGVTTARSTTSPLSFVTEWVAHTIALRPPAGTPSASLTWTASPTTGATGYRLERVVGGTVVATATITPVSTTSTTDGPLVNGTAYTYRLRAYRGTWNSSQVTASLTPSC